MTSSFGPDAKLRWVTFFKLIKRPEDYLEIGHQNCHEIHTRFPFDKDYGKNIKRLQGNPEIVEMRHSDVISTLQ